MTNTIGVKTINANVQPYNEIWDPISNASCKMNKSCQTSKFKFSAHASKLHIGHCCLTCEHFHTTNKKNKSVETLLSMWVINFTYIYSRRVHLNILHYFIIYYYNLILPYFCKTLSNRFTSDLHLFLTIINHVILV